MTKMTKMIKTAIFDLDGTLINSLADLADATNAGLARMGLPTHPAEKYRFFVGNGARKLCERVLPEELRTEEKISELQALFSEEYAKNCLNKTRPYEGIKELITDLGKAGVACAVASNKPDAFSKELISELFGEGQFALVTGKREGVPVKPAPQIVFNILSELGAQPDSAVFIGDSSVDVETAHNAGLECIGCTWGFRGEPELRSAGADHIARSAEDVFEIVMKQ